MKSFIYNSSRYRIALSVAAAACFWGGVTSMGVFFSLMLIVSIAYFIYYQKKGENKKFELAECFIILLGSLSFGVSRFILNDWLLVGLALIVIACSGYYAIKIILMIKENSA